MRKKSFKKLITKKYAIASLNYVTGGEHGITETTVTGTAKTVNWAEKSYNIRSCMVNYSTLECL